MEKNINMQNADDLCLRYVLNELDPSEVLMVEKAMREDEDMLIEIECLRATLRKVNQLPEQSPPAVVRQKILEHAAFRCEQKRRADKIKTLQTSGFAAAAVLMIALGLGFYNYSASPSGENQYTGTSASSLDIPAPQAGLSSVSTPVVLSSQYGNTGRQEVQPWVDRNKVLHINVRSGSQGLTIMNPSVSGDAPASRLVPIERSTGSFNTGMRDIQLTRTQY